VRIQLTPKEYLLKTQVNAKAAFSGHDPLNQSTDSVSTNRAESSLRQIIKYWIVELMDCGGTNPNATCGWIAEQEPELYHALGHARVRALCEELHRAEDTARSEWYGVRLRQFNKEYFDGRLRDYQVRVVYDVSFWTQEPRAEDLLSHIDLPGRQIILAFTQNASWRRMECELIHHMAHGATGTTRDDDNRWLQEMTRLKAAGAPIEQ
jgi:hypothetical protein